MSAAPYRQPGSGGIGDETSARSSYTSLLRLSPGFVLAVIAIADAGRFADPDMWWHLLAGETVLRTGHFIMRDPFSYTAHGLPWLDHERIAEVIMAWTYMTGGIVGLKLFKLACTAITFVMIALTIAETGANRSIQSCVLMVAAVGLGAAIQFRPQLFTFICFSALMLLLTRHNYGRTKRLWLIVPLMLLWANLHGGYLVGLLVFGFYGFVVVIRDVVVGKDWRKDAISFAIIWPAALAMTFITPFGLNNWRAIVRTLSNPMTHGLIAEWKPMLAVMMRHVRRHSLAMIMDGIIAGAMAAFVVTELLTLTLDDLPLALIAGISTAAAIVAIRNMEIAMIALPAPLAHHAALMGERLRGRRKSLPPAESGLAGRRMMIINQVVFGVMAVAVMFVTGLFSKQLVTGIPEPTGAIDYMRSRGLRGNILCDFNWGGYVIYHTAPRSRVFTDSRYDLVYPNSITAEYLKFIWDKPGADRMLDEWPHDFVLISPKSPAWRLMTSRRDWKLLYRDPDCALFARANSPAANAASAAVIGKAQTSYFP
ncbi:MAG TPA: hypothetical protein VJ718_03925 [Candidatus Binataceae bacterium]|nr:hypothetical protein [Candidatus Binataceae bacterium]